MNDFRGKTCGECAWAFQWTYNGGHWFRCRRAAWQDNEVNEMNSIQPACPAFEPLGKPEEAAE